MRVHRCGQQGCMKHISTKYRYCPEHYQLHHQAYLERKQLIDSKTNNHKQEANRNYDKLQRDPERTAFYHSKQWQTVRDYVYSRDMATCQACGNVVTDRKIVDHIIPLRLLNSADKLDTGDLWVLCGRCHNNKTKLEQSMSDNQLKHLDKNWWLKVLRERIAK